MALQATLYRFAVDLSHVDRNIYERLDVRAARHPSETERHLLARLLAHCLLWQEGLEFSKGGLSSPDEPALSVRALDGTLRAWIEVGSPSAERLHKAAKAAPRVVVVTHHDPALLQKEVAGQRVHRAEQIEVFALDPGFLDEIAARIGDRGGALALTVSDGELYVTLDGADLQSSLRSIPLAPAA